MEILKEQNGVFITPYTENEFDMIRNFVRDDHMHLRAGHVRVIDETTIDTIYDYLIDSESRYEFASFGTASHKESFVKSFEWVKENISPEEMKKFLASFGNLTQSIVVGRDVSVRQSLSIMSNEIPKDLDLGDVDAVQSFGDDYADETTYSDWEETDEDVCSVDCITTYCTLSVQYLKKEKIGYEGIAPTVEQEVA